MMSASDGCTSPFSTSSPASKRSPPKRSRTSRRVCAALSPCTSLLNEPRAVLAVRPDDAFAQTTKIQLLAGLDRYKDAVHLLASQADAAAGEAHPLERAYSLYKLGRNSEAIDIVLDANKAGSSLTDTQSRGMRLLEAQVVR